MGVVSEWMSSVVSLVGAPGEGFHARSWCGYAVNDIVGTLAAALATSYAANISLVKSCVL